MGITCSKQIGKVKRVFKKLENQKEKEKQAIRKKNKNAKGENK